MVLPEIDNISVYQALAFEKDPFKQGTNYVCMAHTCLGRYKGALKNIESCEKGYECQDIEKMLLQMEKSYKSVLNIGYCLAKVFGKIYTLEVRY